MYLDTNFIKKKQIKEGKIELQEISYIININAKTNERLSNHFILLFLFKKHMLEATTHVQ